MKGYSHTTGWWCEECHPEAREFNEHCQTEECSGAWVPPAGARCVSCYAEWTGERWEDSPPPCECGCGTASDCQIYRPALGTFHFYKREHLPAADQAALEESAVAEALMESW